MIGRVIAGRYTLQARIGGGGTATVYRAYDNLLNRTVAVKILRPEFAGDEDFVRRFRREARAAASLCHPSIVAVYDVGRDADDCYYIVMEYVDGETLKEHIRRLAPLPVPEAVGIARAILEALDCAHRAGVVHRDVKPQNVIITRDGRPKVADFGVARASATATLAETGAVIGTAHYVSPEQASGKPTDERSDVYSCGVVLYEMLAGRVPFDGEAPLAVALQHIQGRPAPLRELNPGVPEPVERVVGRAMAKNPAERYQSAAAFREDLENALAGRSVAAPPAPAGDPGDTIVLRPRSRRRRRAWPWALGAGLAVALGAGAYVLAARWLNVPTVVVPDVRHLPVVQAESRLRTAHLDAVVFDSRPAEEPPNDVIATDPPPGTPVRQGRTVRLTISSGPPWIPGGVPDVAGLDARDAELRLRDAGLTVAGTRQRYDGSVPAGRAVGTEPPVHAQIAAGGPVTLIVSRGPEPVPFPLPDLVGQRLADAEAQLAAQRLVEGGIDYARGAWPSGIVIATDPRAGDAVKAGDSVRLTVSSGCDHTSTLMLIPVARGPAAVSVRVTVTDEAGGPRVAFQGNVPPRLPFRVDFCWTGAAAQWAEYENGAPLPAQQGVLKP